MKTNMGTFDRVGRIVLAAVLGFLIQLHVVGGPLALVLGALAVVFVATGVAGFCPLYAPFKFSTGPSKPA